MIQHCFGTTFLSISTVNDHSNNQSVVDVSSGITTVVTNTSQPGSVVKVHSHQVFTHHQIIIVNHQQTLGSITTLHKSDIHAHGIITDHHGIVTVQPVQIVIVVHHDTFTFHHHTVVTIVSSHVMTRLLHHINSIIFHHHINVSDEFVSVDIVVHCHQTSISQLISI